MLDQGGEGGEGQGYSSMSLNTQGGNCRIEVSWQGKENDTPTHETTLRNEMESRDARSGWREKRATRVLQYVTQHSGRQLCGIETDREKEMTLQHIWKNTQECRDARSGWRGARVLQYVSQHSGRQLWDEVSWQGKETDTPAHTKQCSGMKQEDRDARSGWRGRTGARVLQYVT